MTKRTDQPPTGLTLADAYFENELRSVQVPTTWMTPEQFRSAAFAVCGQCGVGPAWRDPVLTRLGGQRAHLTMTCAHCGSFENFVIPEEGNFA